MRYKFTICFAYSPWIHYPFFEITMNSLSIARIHYDFTICFAVSVGIRYIFGNHYEFTIHYLFQLSFPRIWYEFDIPIQRIPYEITIGVTKSLSIHYLFRALFHNESTLVFAHSLCFSLIQYKFTICFANSIWMLHFVANSLFIRYLSREITMN